MGINSYLEKLTRTLPTSQGKHILRLLTNKRDSGEIKTVDEFKNKLKELTTELLANRIKPTFKLWSAIVGQEISSEQYNDMLEKIHSDLDVAFEEANNLDDIIEAHHQLIKQVALKTLRLGINQLESQISLYEFIEKNSYGVNDAVFNTFRSSETNRLARSDTSANIVFIDPRLSTFIPDSQEATIDLIGERLILAPDSQTYTTPKKAAVYNGSNTTLSELDVQFQNANINNILDGKNNTYWAIPIYLSSIKTSGVTVEIELQLNASQDINLIEIEPASYFPMKLVGIYYVDSNQVRQTVYSTETILTGSQSFIFSKITTKSLIIALKQENYQEVQVKRERGEVNFYKALNKENSVQIDIDNTNGDLQKTLSSDFLLTEIYNLPPEKVYNDKYFEYIIGMDNIRIGFTLFEDKSIFVSKAKHVEDLGLITLKVVETRPRQSTSETSVSITNPTFSYPARSSTEDTYFYHGSIEYWIFVKNYDSDSNLISIDTLPILPVGASRIYHERLIFTKKTSSSYINYNAGSFVHYTNGGVIGAADVNIYRNGSLLTYVDDWEFSNDSDLTQTDPAASARMKRGVYLTIDPNPLDIYTVSYTPIVSNSYLYPSNTDLLNVISLGAAGKIRVVKDNIIVIDKIRNSKVIKSADVYLSIIMRSNSANTNLTPVVEEFLLAVGSVDQNKFVRDY